MRAQGSEVTRRFLACANENMMESLRNSDVRGDIGDLLRDEF